MRSKIIPCIELWSSRRVAESPKRPLRQLRALCLLALIALWSAPALFAQTPISSGEAVMGSISVGSQDTYTFTANAGDSVILRIGELSDSGNFFPQITLLNPAGMSIDSSRGYVEAQVGLQLTQTGTYKVIIDSYQPGQGMYKLYFAKAPGPFTVSDDGGVLPNNQSRQGTHTIGDLDLFSFVAYSGQTITLTCGELSQSGGEFIPEILLYDPAGTLVSSGRGYTEAKVTYNATKSGTYLVVITSYSTAGATGTYQLTLSRAIDPPKADFNGDLLPDWVLINPSTRQPVIWSLNLYGTTVSHGGYLQALPPGWSIVDAGHFGASSTTTDLVLFNPSTRQTAFWFLSGSGLAGGASGRTLPPGWKLLLSQDFNGDTNPDLLLEDTAGHTAVWYLSPYLNGTSVFGGAYGPNLPAGWQVAGAADFNGDYQADLLLWNPSTRQTYIWYLNGTTRVGYAAGPTIPAGWLPSAVDDFNRDGKPDLVLWSPMSHQTAIWYLSGTFGNLHAATASRFGPTIAAGFALVAPK